MMFFMPMLQCAAIAVFLVPWVVYSVYTASMADVSWQLFIDILYNVPVVVLVVMVVVVVVVMVCDY